MKIFYKQEGAISVFLVLVLVPVLVVCAVFVDASRMELAKAVVESAADLTLNTALTRYDEQLNDYYGLMGSAQNTEEFMDAATDYFKACITSQGVETGDASRYANEIRDIFVKGNDISDFLRIRVEDDEGVKITPVENGNLTNPALIKKELVEFMKYRAPVDGVKELIEKFKKGSKDLENAEKNADLVDKKQQYYEQEGELCDKLVREAAAKMKEYEAEIESLDVEKLKEVLEDSQNDYNSIHTLLVKDLFNTSNKGMFEHILINTDEEDSTFDDENPASAGRIKNRLKNCSDTMYAFIHAKKKMDQCAVMMNIDDNVYKVQYWIQMVDLLDDTDAYDNYRKKAKSLCKAMAKLNNAVEYAEEDALGKTCTLSAKAGVNARGKETLRDHYKTMKSQFSKLKNEMKSADSPYNTIGNTLRNFSTLGLRVIEGSRDNVESMLAKIYPVLSGQYKCITKSMDLIGETVKRLKEAKKLSKEYKERFDSWEGAANGDTDLAKEDEKQIDNIKSGNEDTDPSKVSEKNIQELINRLNNIKSLLGELKAGIDEYKYNGTPIKTIATLDDLKRASGVDKNRISYKVDELDAYARESFRFTESSRLKRVGITDNNNPSLTIKKPEIYDWMDEQYKEIKDEGVDKKKEQKKREIEKSEKQAEKVDTKGSSSNGNEIVTKESLPSGKGESQANGKVSDKIKDVSKFVTGMFTDFSQKLKDGRDAFYILDYVTGMFSYDTYEMEGKYNLLKKKGGDVPNLNNYQSLYQSVEGEWKSTEPDKTYNKSLTNKMIDTENNWSYQNEIEYILYGGKNSKNKQSAYTSIYMVRFAMNLPVDFKEYWSDRIIRVIASSISISTGGIIPEFLVRIIILLGIVAAESAVDLAYLSKGMPVPLYKKKEELFISPDMYQDDDLNPESKEFSEGFQYSDYLSLFLFLKLLGDSSSEKAYLRIADVIQVNIGEKQDGFRLEKSIVYYKMNVATQVSPLLLKIPLIEEESENVAERQEGYYLNYEMVKGY